MHINLDEIKNRKGYGDVNDDDVPEKIWKSIFDEADRKLVKSLNEGKNVVNETAWVTRAWRDRARSVAEKEGFSTKVIYISIPESVARGRWQKNKGVKQRDDTKDKEFEDYIKDFEIPRNDEGVISYNQILPLEKWIQINFDK